MKVFKMIDCTIQGILIVLGLFLGLTHESLDEMFLLGYFLVGGCQLLSAIVHFFYKAPYSTKLRRIYLIVLGIVILVIGLSIPTEGIIVVLIGLLFLSPVMAVYYLVTCIKETQSLALVITQDAVPVAEGV